MNDTAEVLESQTRQRVREAAFRLFGQFGYDGVSMTRVAADAGVTKAGLYWHYHSKESLYADAVRELIELFESYVFEPASETTDPVDQIFILFDGFEEMLEDHRIAQGIGGYWLRPSTARADEAAQVQNSFHAAATEALEITLEQARREGTLTLDVSTRDMAQTFISLMEAIVLPLGHRNRTDHRRTVQVLSHIFFTAYAPQLVDRSARRARLGEDPG